MNWQDALKHLGGMVIAELGPVVGSMLGGPAGGVIAGKVGEMIAERLGVEPAPDVVAKQPPAEVERVAREIAGDSGALALLVPLWQAEVERAAANDRIEAEKGFGAWHARRTATHYLILLMLGSSFFISLGQGIGALRGDAAAVMALVGHAVALFFAWNGLISGGRAATDIAKALKGGGK